MTPKSQTSIADHEFWMRRAIELAARGGAEVSPNPQVGSVIVGAQGQWVAEGWHKVYGGPHAEVVAYKQVWEPEWLEGATWYVTLEPCAHYGKTPPCAELIANTAVKTVVIGTLDPNPAVAGKGVEMLRAAGKEVIVGILEAECQQVARAFLHRMRTGLPYVTLKWAQTADGFLARHNGDSKWISSALSRAVVHKLRAEVDLVWVGGATALHDNPRLDLRDWHGKQPSRLFMTNGKPLPETHYLLDGNRTTFALGVGPEGILTALPAHIIKLQQHLHDLKDATSLKAVLQELAAAGIQHILVEGGSSTLNLFITAGLWQEAWVVTNPEKYFQAGIAAPTLKEANLSHTEMLQEDIWQHWLPAL